MCEECKAATAAAVAALVVAWERPETPGSQVIARMLKLAAIDERAPSDRRYGVDQVMLDTYETQRRDAISITSSLIVAMTQIKNRLLDEAGRAGDKRMINLEWDGERNGFHVKAKDIDGNPIEQFEPVAFGESAGQAATRITLGYLQQNGEIHG